MKIASQEMLLILSGPSGIGKNSVIRQLAENKECFRFITPLTTRSMRDNEMPNIDYEFLSKEQFQELIKLRMLFDWDYTLGNYYGFRVDAFQSYDGHVLVTHALAKMALRIKSRINNVITIFLDPINREHIIHRLSIREGTNNNEMRIQHGIDEQAHRDLFDYVIKANNTCKFIDQIMRVIRENKCFNSDWRRRCAPPPAS